MQKLIKKILKPFLGAGTDPVPPDDAQKLNYGKSEFIRRISHEIQGNFFGVTSVCAMLKIAVENKEDTTILFDHLLGACHTYKYGLNNFLEYNRLEAGLYNTLYEAIDIRSLVNRLARENQHSALEKKATIQVTVSDEMPEQIIGDETRITQICTNLLINAIRSARPGSNILVQVRTASDNQWILIVEDQSEGISIEKLNRVFQLSFSGRHANSMPESLNLGLFVTKHLVEDVLKGEITMSSQPGIGTRCAVVLALR
jgi:signal transduction histidine kinase